MNCIIIPFLGALIGWLSAMLFFCMLIYPRRPVSFGFFSVQGYLPKHASSIGKQLMKELCLERTIKELLSSCQKNPEIERAIDPHLDHLILAMKQQIPLAGMFLSSSLIDKMKSHAKIEIVKMLPNIGGDVAACLLQQPTILEKLEGTFRQIKWESLIDIKRDGIPLSFYGASCGFLTGLLIAFCCWLFTLFA